MKTWAMGDREKTSSLRSTASLFERRTHTSQRNRVYVALRRREGRLKHRCTRQNIGAILTHIAQAHADFFRQRITKAEIIQDVVSYPAVSLQGLLTDIEMSRFPHTDALDSCWNPVALPSTSTGQPHDTSSNRRNGKRKDDRDINPVLPKAPKVGDTDVEAFQYQHPILKETVAPLMNKYGKIQIFKLLKLANVQRAFDLPGMAGRCTRCELTRPSQYRPPKDCSLRCNEPSAARPSRSRSPSPSSRAYKIGEPSSMKL